MKLPEGVACYAIAGTKTLEAQSGLLSDGLVPVDRALGGHDLSHLDLNFPETHRWIAYGAGHLDLLSDAKVYAQIRAWLSPTKM